MGRTAHMQPHACFASPCDPMQAHAVGHDSQGCPPRPVPAAAGGEEGGAG